MFTILPDSNEFAGVPKLGSYWLKGIRKLLVPSEKSFQKLQVALWMGFWKPQETVSSDIQEYLKQIIKIRDLWKKKI